MSKEVNKTLNEITEHIDGMIVEYQEDIEAVDNEDEQHQWYEYANDNYDKIKGHIEALEAVKKIIKQYIQ